MATRQEAASALLTLFEALMADAQASGDGEGERWLSVVEAAAYVGMKDDSTIRAWIATGELRYGRAGREYRLRRSDLDAFLLRHEEVGEEPLSAPVGTRGLEARVQSILKSL